MSLFRPDFNVEPFTYRGLNLREIAFPLGGIGTGCVSLDGRGGLRDWEIFNRPNKGSLLDHTFPALWVKSQGQPAQAVAVQGPRVRDWIGEGAGFASYGGGNFFKQMDGLPQFDTAEFVSTFPFARVRFQKENLPVNIELAAFNPFIPLDVRSSSFPGACLIYRVENRSKNKVEATLAWTVTNPVGEGVKPTPEEPDRAKNSFFQGDACSGILYTNDRFGPENSANGAFALTTNWPQLTHLAQWESGEWFDAMQSFWNAFRPTGRLDTIPSSTGARRSPGTLGALLSLEPGEVAEVPFLLSWVFPTATKYWGGENEPKAAPWKPHYATEWPTPVEAAEEFFDRYDELTSRTLSFENALFTSTLPPEVIESVSATASILHSPTVLRLEDGTFWAWEGCEPSSGCCAGTCSHVWNYSLAHAYLFPEMQWNMRRAEYRHNFNCGPRGKEGALNFRLMIPLGAEAPLWHAASDGQLGGVVQLYRDWRLSGDADALRELWPSAKRALEFAWVQWDGDKDGLVEGDMHNTYDINFQGPNPLTQFFYLAALRAGEAIARHLGDSSAANTYQTLYLAGKLKTEDQLWNGEFFVQTPDVTGSDAPKYQHGIGCLSDQLFGQWAATAAGLGDLVGPELVKQALAAIYKYNFRSPLGDHENLQRVYAVADEAGLLLCSWPNGGRPFFPFVYSDEVWTGIEYQVASHLAWEGMVDEALSIVQGIRHRYDGQRRNPLNEFECGSHYARAMASYGLLLAFSGFQYDAVNRTATVDPRISGAGSFRCFYCCPSGWGIATKDSTGTKFEPIEGALFP